MTTELYFNDFLNSLVSIYEFGEAANITDWVFESITGWNRFKRTMYKEVELPIEQVQQLDKYLRELLKHKPVQYILNEAWFYKMKFYVNESVLIPRPETEELVEWIIDDFSGRHRIQSNNFKTLDIGTGSGCISISLKKELKDIENDAIDISENALEIAKKNAAQLNAKINFFKLDFLSESLWNSLEMYDVIISNPPYIPALEKEKLAKNVTEFEPEIALFVPGNDPFIFYEKIAKFAQSHLNANGNVYVEIHENYSGEVQQIFDSHNFKTEIRKDIYGKDRMIKAN